MLGFGRHHIRHAQKQGKLTIPLQSKQVRCCCVLRVGLLPHPYTSVTTTERCCSRCTLLLLLQDAAGTPWAAGG